MNAPSILEYLKLDHDRLHGLLDRTLAHPTLDLGTFDGFRRGLLRHIGVEEKLLFPHVRKARGGQLLDRAYMLRIEHAALTSLLVPTPDRLLCLEISSLLAAHDAKEEGPGGVYEECGAWLNEADQRSLGARAISFPEVPVAPHFDGPSAHRTADSALASARRVKEPRQRS